MRTLDVFQADKSDSKYVAPLNMKLMLRTFDTSQRERSWLKSVFPSNIPTMPVAPDTSCAKGRGTSESVFSVV